jgi:hypothetical protein
MRCENGCRVKHLRVSRKMSEVRLPSARSRHVETLTNQLKQSALRTADRGLDLRVCRIMNVQTSMQATSDADLLATLRRRCLSSDRTRPIASRDHIQVRVVSYCSHCP